MAASEERAPDHCFMVPVCIQIDWGGLGPSLGWDLEVASIPGFCALLCPDVALLESPLAKQLAQSWHRLGTDIWHNLAEVGVSPKETLAAAVAPTECRGSYFATVPPTGAGQLRIGLPSY